MVLPIGDNNPTRRRAVVTFLLVAINIAVYLLVQPTGTTCADVAFYYRWASVPSELTSFGQLSGATLDATLGQCAAAVGPKNVLLSIVTSLFLHGSLLHLGGNMLYLWIFGNNVEDHLGRLRYLVFYLAGGVIATYAFALTNPGSVAPLIGASGAIAAILGAYLVLYPRAKIHTYVPFPLTLIVWLIPGRNVRGWFFFFAIADLPAWIVLIGWFALQVIATTSPTADAGVAYAAHAGGFIAGMIGAALLRRRGAFAPA